MKLSDLTLDYIDECFDYNSRSGVLTWRKRPRSHFPTKVGATIFNKIYAGKRAGHLKNNGYRTVCVSGLMIHEHRLIHLWMTGELPKNQIDHIDGNPSNNAWDNLREVDYSDNQKNRKMSINNSSGIMGVHKDGNKWRAQIGHRGETYCLGSFDNKNDASLAREIAEEIFDFHPNHGTARCTKS